jgi:hypothetical protein
MPETNMNDTTPKSAAARRKGTTRKRWIRRTPVDVVLEQEEKLREEVTRLDQELHNKRAQLLHFEGFRKSMEAANAEHNGATLTASLKHDHP